MSAFTGRDVVLEFAIGNETDNPASLTFKRLGMLRDKSLPVTWDTVDTTADMSPAFTKTNLVTFKAVEANCSGVAYTDAIYNQSELKAHVYNPGAGTGNQPKVWLKQTAPDGVTQGPFIVSSWDSASPYADVVTFQLTAMSNGAVTFTPA